MSTPVNNKSYKEQNDLNNIARLRKIIKELPKFCVSYFLSMEATKSTRTRLSYAYDLRVFFTYLQENNPSLNNKKIHDFSLNLLDELTPMDIEEFVSYLQSYKHNNLNRVNRDSGILRKLASVRSMYNYYYKKELIKTNPPAHIDNPKLHTKNIIRLDSDEIVEMLDVVESGKNLSKTQLINHDKTKLRDIAIITLLLGTGIRVSECVGLNLTDIDFKNCCIKVIRKGGNEDVVYFGEEVLKAIDNYLTTDRNKIKPNLGHEDALFISLKYQRITPRSVERLVKKYAQNVTTLKKITPHKLRSTYGTNLYKETGDIYLVADVLGHKDVNTTKKHYAAIADDRKRDAANIVKLRKT